jgi:hypothetical protein
MNIYKTKNPLSQNLNYAQHRFPPPPEIPPSISNTPPPASNMSLFSQNINSKGKYKMPNGITN